MLPLHFAGACRDWTGPGLAATLQRALESLPPGSLPLHLGVAQGGVVDDTDMAVTVLRVGAAADRIDAEVGVFFTEIVGGCSCGDDPAPQHAYCRLHLSIDRSTGAASCTLVVD